MGISRRHALLGGGLGALAAPAVATTAQEVVMVTSWPTDSPGPGWTARRTAEAVQRLSGGALRVRLYGAGELVPPLEVFDATARGVAHMAHTASLFWQSRTPLAAFFTTVPFGLLPFEHMQWLEHGGGQALWDRLYARFGVKGLACGNTGVQMGGWLRKTLRSREDLVGLKFRIPGLGGEIFRRMGVVPVTLPPGEIYTALASGLLDGAEFLGPWADTAFGFSKVSSVYYGPSFNEPNGTGELLVNRDFYHSLGAEQQEILKVVCRGESAYSWGESNWHNAAALNALRRSGFAVRPWPEDIEATAQSLAPSVLEDAVVGDALGEEILASYQATLARVRPWNDLAIGGTLSCRR